MQRQHFQMETGLRVRRARRALALTAVITGLLCAGTFSPHLVQASEASSSAAPETAAYNAYLDILQTYRDEILGYDWQTQYSTYDFTQGTPAENEPRHVAFSDLNGDGVPELLFIAAMNADLTTDDSSRYACTLFVYTYADGAAQKVFTMEWMDVQAGGGSRYCLFKKSGSNDLYIYYSSGDENWTYDLTGYTLEGTVMAQSSDLREEMTWQEDETGLYNSVYTYYKDENVISQSDYIQEKTQLCAAMSDLIMYNYIDEDEGSTPLRDAVAGRTPSAVEVDEAISIARSHSSSDSDSASGSAEELSFSYILGGREKNFTFASGVGAWDTTLTVYTDGSFSGYYHDSEMGDNRSPGGVRYECRFSGVFTDLAKVDDYTWSMQLGNIITEHAEGEQWMDGEVLVIASYPYGLEGGGQFLLYLPGHASSTLPEGFLSWVQGWSGNQAALPYYGLYHVSAQEGFWGEEAQAADAPTFYRADAGTSQSAICASSAVSMTTSSGQVVTVDGTVNGYLFPDSDTRLLTESDISGMSWDLIQQAVNEIYARHGYIFKDETILAFYRQFSWYTPSVSDMNTAYAAMNSTEQANIDFMSQYL